MRRTLLALACLLAPTTAAAADLVVRIEGIVPVGGTVRLGLFDSAEGFAARREGVRASRNLPVAADGVVETTFVDLAPGRWAVTAHHDVDDDRELDRFLGLLPSEGVALSNDPPLVPAPGFDDIALAVRGERTVVLRMVYPLGRERAVALSDRPRAGREAPRAGPAAPP